MIAIEKLKQAALEDVDSMDDYARMETGIAPIGTVNNLTNFINTVCTRLEAAESQLEDAEILQARDERVAEACCKVVDDVVDTFGAHSLVGVVKAKIRSCEWRKYL